MEELVITQQRETVLEIILNRSDKRNAINALLFEQFEAAVITASRTPGLRAVVIRGAGKVFSAGIDVSSLLGLADQYGPHWQQRMRTITDDFQRVLNRLERLELPTIALLHGHCLGLAFELALACDICLAAEGTMLGLPETRLGIHPRCRWHHPPDPARWARACQRIDLHRPLVRSVARRTMGPG